MQSEASGNADVEAWRARVDHQWQLQLFLPRSSMFPTFLVSPVSLAALQYPHHNTI